MIPHWQVLILHPSQKSERSPYWNRWSHEVKKYDVEVPSTARPPHYISLNALIVWKVFREDTHTDRRNSYLISFNLILREKGYKKRNINFSHLNNVACQLNISKQLDKLVCWNKQPGLTSDFKHVICSIQWGQSASVYCVSAPHEVRFGYPMTKDIYRAYETPSTEDS
jgi:hypothetical protein